MSFSPENRFKSILSLNVENFYVLFEEFWVVLVLVFLVKITANAESSDLRIYF